MFSARVRMAATACNEAQQQCVDLLQENTRLCHCTWWWNDSTDDGYIVQNIEPPNRTIHTVIENLADIESNPMKVGKAVKSGFSSTESGHEQHATGSAWELSRLLLTTIFFFFNQIERIVSQLLARIMRFRNLLCYYFAVDYMSTPFSQVSDDSKPAKTVEKGCGFSVSQHWNKTSGSGFSANHSAMRIAIWLDKRGFAMWTLCFSTRCRSSRPLKICVCQHDAQVSRLRVKT